METIPRLSVKSDSKLISFPSFPFFDDWALLLLHFSRMLASFTPALVRQPQTPLLLLHEQPLWSPVPEPGIPPMTADGSL